jgi:hypothetical protein
LNPETIEARRGELNVRSQEFSITILTNKVKVSAKLGAVAPTCNPSYSGGRDQDNRGLRPVQAKVSETPFQLTAVRGGAYLSVTQEA